MFHGAGEKEGYCKQVLIVSSRRSICEKNVQSGVLFVFISVRGIEVYAL